MGSVGADFALVALVIGIATWIAWQGTRPPKPWRGVDTAPPHVAQGLARLRRDHAAWSAETFGAVGPVGALRHLAKEAIEAAENPGDLSEWADLQFLLWDAQRRAGVTDEQLLRAGIAKLAKLRRREWPAAVEGQPCEHVRGIHD